MESVEHHWPLPTIFSILFIRYVTLAGKCTSVATETTIAYERAEAFASPDHSPIPRNPFDEDVAHFFMQHFNFDNFKLDDAVRVRH